MKIIESIQQHKGSIVLFLYLFIWILMSDMGYFKYMLWLTIIFTLIGVWLQRGVIIAAWNFGFGKGQEIRKK